MSNSFENDEVTAVTRLYRETRERLAQTVERTRTVRSTAGAILRAARVGIPQGEEDLRRAR